MSLLLTLLQVAKMVTTISEPINVVEQQNLLIKISLISGIISALAVIITAIITYNNWNKTKKFKRIEYLQSLRAKLYDDKDVAEVLYKFDYELPWYSETFHTTPYPQIHVDKALSVLEYICYLLKNDFIDQEQFLFFKYDLERALTNAQVQDYLYNLYHWTNEIHTPMAFSCFLEYGKANGYFDAEFEDKNSYKKPQSKYHNYVEFI